MAIDYFQPMTFQQANPLLAGLQAGQQIFSQGIQNAYLPQTLAQQLQQMRAQTGLTQAQIPLTQAQAGLVGAQTQFFPMTAMGQYYGGLGRYLQGTYNWSPAHNIALLIKTPEFQSMLANNRALAQPVADIMASATTGGALGTPPGTPSMQPPVNSGTTIPLTPAQQKTYAALLQRMQDGQEQGVNSLNAITSPPLGNGSILNPSDVSALQDTAGSDVLKKTQTSQVLNQRQYSQILNPLLEHAQQLMPSVAQYAGVQGRIKLLKDRGASALGINSPDYTNYTIFTNTIAPNAANELRRVLGGQATDSEREVMDELVDPTYWHSNPELALTQFQSLVDLYKNSVDPALAKSPAQVQQNLQSIGKSNTSSTNNSTNSVQATKTLNGKTYVKINGRWFQQ